MATATDDLTGEIAHLRALQVQHQKNIRRLEETLALHGMDRPLHLINELDFEREQLRQVEEKLALAKTPLRLLDLRLTDRPQQAGHLPPPLERFPAGTAEIFVACEYRNVPYGLIIAVIVYDSTGKRVADSSYRFVDDENGPYQPCGVSSFRLRADTGEFPPGSYRVEVLAGADRVGRLEFVVMSGSGG